MVFINKPLNVFNPTLIAFFPSGKEDSVGFWTYCAKVFW
jgi:hypothetical protein